MYGIQQWTKRCTFNEKPDTKIFKIKKKKQTKFHVAIYERPPCTDKTRLARLGHTYNVKIENFLKHWLKFSFSYYTFIDWIIERMSNEKKNHTKIAKNCLFIHILDVYMLMTMQRVYKIVSFEYCVYYCVSIIYLWEKANEFLFFRTDCDLGRKKRGDIPSQQYPT